jgi:hypothetical protein
VVASFNTKYKGNRRCLRHEYSTDSSSEELMHRFFPISGPTPFMGRGHKINGPLLGPETRESPRARVRKWIGREGGPIICLSFSEVLGAASSAPTLPISNRLSLSLYLVVLAPIPPQHSSSLPSPKTLPFPSPASALPGAGQWTEEADSWARRRSPARRRTSSGTTARAAPA